MRYKILLVTSLSKPWNNGWYYKAGFESNGHEVRCFDCKSLLDPVAEIFRAVGEYRPDLLLHTKGELPPEVFLDLMKLTTVVQWYPDLAINDEVKAYAAACHVFLTVVEGALEEFKKSNPHSFWLPQAFEPSFFHIEGITQRDEALYTTDLTFVGSLGSKSGYLFRREYLKAVVDAGFRFKWWGPRIPRKLSNIPLIFGKIGRAHGGKFVWGEDYAKVARLSKIFLAFDIQPHVGKAISARMYTAVGCGAFYMCRHVEGIEELLRPEREIVTFRTQEEMLDKVKFYMVNEQARKTIAEAGRNRVLKEHTYGERMARMIKIIEGARS